MEGRGAAPGIPHQARCRGSCNRSTVWASDGSGVLNTLFPRTGHLFLSVPLTPPSWLKCFSLCFYLCSFLHVCFHFSVLGSHHQWDMILVDGVSGEVCHYCLPWSSFSGLDSGSIHRDQVVTTQSLAMYVEGKCSLRPYLPEHAQSHLKDAVMTTSLRIRLCAGPDLKRPTAFLQEGYLQPWSKKQA